MSASPKVVVWFRRDLRLADNPALSAAVESGLPILPVYVFDEEGEGAWPDGAASKWWLHRSLESLDADLRSLGSRLTFLRGDSRSALLEFCEAYSVQSVFWNRRYEPAIVERDTLVKKALADRGVQARSFNFIFGQRLGVEE